MELVMERYSFIRRYVSIEIKEEMKGKKNERK